VKNEDKKPRMIKPQFQKEIDDMVDKLLIDTPYYEFCKDFRGYITQTVRGRASRFGTYFTVPYWAYTPHSEVNKRTNNGYFIYYTAHELAHIIANSINEEMCHHDSRFYKIFMEICPKEFQYFELAFKPSCKKYGIKKPDGI